MFPVLQIGPVALPLPGLILIAGVWIGLLLSERYALRQGANPEHIYNLAFTGLVVGLLGARMGYVLAYPAPFLSNPISLVSANPGLLDPVAGVVTGCLAGLIFGQRKHLPFWGTLDLLTPFLAVMSLSIGFSHLASGEAFGAAAQLPWSIELWGAARHPSQVYEMLAALAILGLTWPSASNRIYEVPGRGFLIFLAFSSAASLFLEGFRGDSILILNGLRQNQVIAWVILAICLAAIYSRRVTR